MLHKSHERLSLAESWSLKGYFDVCNWRWVYLKQGLQVYECQEGVGGMVGGVGGGRVSGTSDDGWFPERYKQP